MFLFFPNFDSILDIGLGSSIKKGGRQTTKRYCIQYSALPVFIDIFIIGREDLELCLRVIQKERFSGNLGNRELPPLIT